MMAVRNAVVYFGKLKRSGEKEKVYVMFLMDKENWLQQSFTSFLV